MACFSEQKNPKNSGYQTGGYCKSTARLFQPIPHFVKSSRLFYHSLITFIQVVIELNGTQSVRQNYLTVHLFKSVIFATYNES